MKKMKLILILLLVTFAVAFCQPDKDFNAIVTFNKGFRFSPAGTIYTSLPAGGVADWNTMINKPSVFTPATHDHNSLYKAIGYVPTYAEITGKPTLFSGSYTDLTNKPESIELADAILSMSGIKLPVLTTTQINALTPVVGLLVYDSTLNVLKIYVGTWKIVITAN
jgi:hypothetical protein